ncbi:MAG: transposase [Acidobacteriia bacterium]|nr:transposase [Terriglobia bacterium]
MTRRKYPAEEKIRILLEGIRGEVSVSELCRRKSINPTICYISNDACRVKMLFLATGTCPDWMVLSARFAVPPGSLAIRPRRRDRRAADRRRFGWRKMQGEKCWRNSSESFSFGGFVIFRQPPERS